ncbi:MAG: BatA domain-containing protein [Planctomycetaceae bacterium]|nr:BatA domain-containing protein [Planctomycetaceae bacterium]
MNRLTFVSPSGLWAFTAVAVVVVLYLLYRCHRPQPVTGLFLWGRAVRHSDGGRRLDSPLKNRAFWYDILAASLLGLALGGPALTGGDRPVVVILDNSFAMRSRDNHPAAAETARRLMDGADRSALVLAGVRPRLLLDCDHSPRQAAAAAENYRPDEPSADLAAAVALAADIWGDAPDIHIVTNQDIAATSLPAPGRVTRHILAGRGDNLAVTDAWRRPSRSEPGRDRVVAVVRNWSRADRIVGVAIRAGYGAAPAAGAVAVDDFSLPAGAGRFVEFTVPQSQETLWLTVGGPGEDVIPDDSRLALPPPDRRRPTFRCDGAAAGLERFVAPALRAAGAVPADNGDAPDILVVSGWEPSGTGRGVAATLAFVAPVQPGVPIPPYLVAGDAALTRDVDLSRVVWTAAAGTVADYPVVRELVRAGPLPLVWLDGDGRVVANAFLEENDLFRHAAWPVLIGNIVEQAADNLPGIRRRIVRPGEPLRIVPEPGQGTESGQAAEPRSTPYPNRSVETAHTAEPERSVESTPDADRGLPADQAQTVEQGYTVTPGQSVELVRKTAAEGTTEPRLYREGVPVPVTFINGVMIAPREPGLYNVRETAGGGGVAVSVVPSFGAAADTTALSDRERIVADNRLAGNADQPAGTQRLDWVVIGLAAIPILLNWRRRREG